MNHRHFAALAAMNLFIGVAFGAFGAHALQGKLSPTMAAAWQTGVHYQQLHGLGLFAIAWLLAQSGAPIFRRAGILMLTGIALFSGSLYALALTEIRWLGAITPLGGLAFLTAWAMVAIGAWPGRQPASDAATARSPVGGSDRMSSAAIAPPSSITTINSHPPSTFKSTPPEN